MVESGTLSPRHATVLGGLAGLFTSLALFSGFLLLSDAQGAVPVPTEGKKATADPNEKYREYITRCDDSIKYYEKRLEELRGDLAAAKASELGSVGEISGTPALAQDFSGAADAPPLSPTEPSLVIVLEQQGLDPTRDAEWKVAVATVFREVKRDEFLEVNLYYIPQQIMLLDRFLRMNDDQKRVLQRIREKESAEMAELSSRRSVDNKKEIDAELIRVQVSAADEFRGYLTAEQAARLGPTLNAIRK